MMKFSLSTLLLLILLPWEGTSQNINVTVNTAVGQKSVSPYIYGRNNNFSNVFGTPTSSENIELYKEAGLKFARENNGNNATKYNWKRKISSHPDWYNNVYDHDWDYAGETIKSGMPGVQVMWAFQLIGKVASNKNNNFNDWDYNQSQWWEGVAQNLAGGGQVNPNGGHKALVDGDPDLYLMDWPADSTTAILDHWFSASGLGFDQNQFLYWSMDNEPEIWNGTHDDVMPAQLPADDYLDLYFKVAKKAREKFPDIRLAGPVPANEWQWYKWSDETLKIDGKYYCWLEYFIKRVADEQKSTGIRLLDVLDIHWYPSESEAAEVLQSHRVFYDEEYVYPGANGIKTINGGWDTSQNKEYIFKRIENWLDEHFGEGHGISLSLSEFGSNTSNPDVNAVLYASMLGSFADRGVEIFTPWTWKPGMWEILHLFSRYAKNISVSTTSDLENIISGYSTINTNADSMTVILVNRDINTSKNVTVNLNGFTVSTGNYTALELSSLPGTETFESHSSNALKNRTVDVSSDHSFQISLPPLSVTAVLLKAGTTDVVLSIQGAPEGKSMSLFPNPTTNSFTLDFVSAKPMPSDVIIYGLSGKKYATYCWINSGKSPLTIDISDLDPGMYFVEVGNALFVERKKLVIKKEREEP